MANPPMGNPDDLTTGARVDFDEQGDIEIDADAVKETRLGEEISLEELEEELEARGREAEFDEDGVVDTAHGDGTAYYPLKAQQQGLVYIPPDDPPILPSDDLQGIEIAAGFAKDVELDDSRGEVPPPNIEGNDWDLQARIADMLRKSSMTNTMPDLHVRVRDGVVHLTGQVETLDDVDVVCSLIENIDGVVDIEEDLEVASL